jgi:hypothetical protein
LKRILFLKVSARVQSILDAAEESLVMVEEDTLTGLLAKKMVKVSKKIVEVQNKYVHLQQYL